GELYHYTVAACVDDLRTDPFAVFAQSAREVGIEVDFRDPTQRLCASAAFDAVRFTRREKLMAAIAKLPVTVISEGNGPIGGPAGNRVAPSVAHTAQSVVDLIGRSRLVLCPLPQYTGHDPLVLAALGAGAVAVSSPSAIYETQFVAGREMVFYETAEEAAD